MRKLTPLEEKRLAVLTANSVELALIEPTKTGLEKSILDATAPVRRYLEERGVHAYDRQKQGKEHKVVFGAFLVGPKVIVPSKVSLYRPVTKNGDPRIWFKGLPSFCSPNDILALIVFNHEIYVLNITNVPLDEIMESSRSGPVWDLISGINKSACSVADELLSKLRKVAAAGFVPSLVDKNADTAVGRTLEKLLGIKINSSKQPDYKGIELKSYRSARGGRESRKTLFAQVANWELSKFKSSREILQEFGYASGGDFKLYCTVTTRKRNSQGLQFVLDQDTRELIETSDKKEVGAFATWLLDDLRQRLLEKHNETFWVAATSKMISGKEHFSFTKVLHTRKPIFSQFDILLEQGVITMDHLIKKSQNGRVSEKGPLFKIESASLELLFPPAKAYDLVE